MHENRLALAEALYQSKKMQAICKFSEHMKQCMGANAVQIFCNVYEAHIIVYMSCAACAQVPALVVYHACLACTRLLALL